MHLLFTALLTLNLPFALSLADCNNADYLNLKVSANTVRIYSPFRRSSITS